MAGLDVLFGRVEPRRQAGAYLTGLLAPIERKNGWQLAEAAGTRLLLACSAVEQRPRGSPAGGG